MKKAVTCGVVAMAMAASVWAQASAPAKKSAKDLTPEEREARKAQFAKMIYEKTGGKVRDTRAMKGAVWFVNAQTRADAKWIREAAATQEERYRLDMRFADGTFDVRKPEKRGEITIFVVDDATLPMSLCASEAGWAVVNVAPLAEGRGEKPAFFEARFKKELSRVFGMATGACGSTYNGNIMDPIVTAEALDNYPTHNLPFDVIGRAGKYLQAHGIAPYAVVPYVKACHEGWAAAPTNDVQKAVWEKVHQLPTEPIKIKPETKKVAD